MCQGTQYCVVQPVQVNIDLPCLQERYASFDSGIGAAVESGQMTLAKLEVCVCVARDTILHCPFCVCVSPC